MKNKLLAIIGTGVMLVSTLSPVLQAEAKAPKTLTKQQALSYIKKYDSDTPKKKIRTMTSKTYKDVKVTNTTVKWAYERGYISKTKSGKYKPNSKITQDQLSKLIVRGNKIGTNTKNKKRSKGVSIKEAKVLDSWGVYKSREILTKGVYKGKSKVTVDTMWKYIDASADAQEAYAASKKKKVTPKLDIGYIQFGEKIPTYDQALDYTQFEAKLWSISKPKNDRKDFVIYTKGPNYREKLTERIIDEKFYIGKKENPYIRYGFSMMYEPRKIGKVYRNVVTLNYPNTEAINKRSDAEFAKLSKKVQAKKPTTDYEVVVAVNEVLAAEYEYNDQIGDYYKLIPDVTGWFQCAEYADIGKHLLDLNGIETRALSGSLHAWIGVKIGGKWYHTDPTFYDTSGKETKYLVMTDAQRFQKPIKSYYSDSDTIKTPTKAFDINSAYKLKK